MTETTTKVRTCDHCGTDLTKQRHIELAACRPLEHFDSIVSEKQRHFCDLDHLTSWIGDRPDRAAVPVLPLEKR